MMIAAASARAMIMRGAREVRWACSVMEAGGSAAICIALPWFTLPFYSKNTTNAMPHPAGTFTLGHSPDPDDAFMFYALAENKIDTRGYRFEHILQDIETLNQRATRGELHISAISIHAYSYVLDKYALLPCGASMGDGYGPLLVAKNRDGLGDNPRLGEVRDWMQGKKI